MKKKLTNDQIKKLGLSIAGLVGLIYVYFSFLLGPLQQTRAATLQKMEDFQRKIASAKPEMAKAAKLEAEAGSATARYDALKSLTPEGAPIAWFPPRIKTFFANQQIEKATAKMEATTPFTEKELAGWTRYTWAIDIPQADYASLGAAVAQLENAEPLLAIRKISIKGLADAPQFQQVTLSAATTLVKR